MLGVVVSVLAVVCKQMRQLLTMLGHAVHRWKDTTHNALETRCNAHAWPRQCWKSSANGNIVALSFGDQGKNLKKFGELLTQKFDRVKTLRNNSQENATTSNNMQQSVQTDVCLRFRFFFVDWHEHVTMRHEHVFWVFALRQCSRFDSRLLDRTQQITSKNAASCWPTMLPPSHGDKNLLTRKQFVKFSDYHEKFRLGYQPLIGKWAHALPALLLRSLLGAGARERRKSSIPRAIRFAGKFFLLRNHRLALSKNQIACL